MNALRADIERYQIDFPGRRLSIAGMVSRSPGLQAVAVYRLGRWVTSFQSFGAKLCAAPLLWLVYVPLNGFIARAYGIRLHLSANIAGGLYVGHVGGIDIRSCNLGRHCSIGQQVQIRPAGPDGTGPQIGERVWIGGHAKVIGSVTVGDGATIAAAAHVTNDVPPNALVLGNPARVVKMFYDNSAILGLQTKPASLAQNPRIAAQNHVPGD